MSGFGVCAVLRGGTCSCSRAKRVSEVDSSCRLLIVPLFRGSSRFESFIVSHHSRFTCECNKGEINDDDDDDMLVWAPPVMGAAP